MRHTIAIILCVLSLIFAIAGSLASIAALFVTDKLVSESQIAGFETSLRTYADALDSMRDNIDVTGSQIPIYAMTLKKTAKLFQDAQSTADDLEKLTSIEVPLPVLGNKRPFGSMEILVRDLREFLPQFAKSLSAAEKSLSGYTAENHEKVIDSIDKTVLLMRTNADQLHHQVRILKYFLNGFLAMCILVSLAHGGLAAAILLAMPEKSSTSEGAAPKRRVSFY